MPSAISWIEINKEGRFWAVKTDGELLAMVLYKNGAKAVQRLVQQLAGLPVEGEKAGEAPKGKVGKPAKKPDKSHGKGKPPDRAHRARLPNRRGSVRRGAAPPG